MDKSKSKNKFVALGSDISRKANIKNEHQVREQQPLMLFSFKDFNRNQGQSYANWQEVKLLAYMLEKFGYICQKTRSESENQGYIKTYRDKSKIDKFGFPLKSEFTNPFPDVILDWAVIMDIKGQKRRVAGYIIENVFYVVFLDAEHLFYPSDKKNT